MATATKRATQDTAPIFRNPQNHVLIKQLLYLCLVTAPAYRFKFELVSACGTEIRLAYKLHTSRPHRRFRSQDRFSLQCVKRPFLRSINCTSVTAEVLNLVITCGLRHNRALSQIKVLKIIDQVEFSHHQLINICKKKEAKE